MKLKRGLSVIVAVALMTAMAAFAEERSPNSAAMGPGAVGKFGNSMAGELFPTMMGTSISVQREFRRALPSIYSYSQTAHYQNRADLGSETGYASASGAGLASVACPTTMCAPNSNWVMWDVPFMLKDTKKRKDGYLGYEQSVSGFATGISRMLGESSAIGLAVGYDYRKLDGRDGYHMKNRADTLHLALYGGTAIGRFFIDGYAGYSRSWNRTQRGIYGDVDPDIITDEVNGNFNDTVLSAGLKASYVWILPNDVRITPSIAADLSHVRTSGLTEKPPIANRALRVDKSDYTSVAMPIMVSLNKTFASNCLRFGGAQSLWTPEIRGGYIPQFGAKRARTANAYASDPDFNWKANSTSFNDSYGTVGAGLKVKLRDKFIFAVDYDFSFASKYTNHSLTAMYGVSF